MSATATEQAAAPVATNNNAATTSTGSAAAAAAADNKEFRANPYGGNPNWNTHLNSNEERLAAFGGEFQPGLYKSTRSRKLGNPAPLGLSAFALTTFVLSLVNCGARGMTQPNVALAVAYGYGGLVQLLAGMWEMAVGNTFGATALSSYGGFWISYAILLTPGFQALSVYSSAADEASALGFFLSGWFIFTFILLICTLRSTVAFFLLFLTLDLAFLMLACSEFAKSNGNAASSLALQHAGGGFGLLSAFTAWYNALAGMADTSNSFFLIPVLHFPWSEKGRENRLQKKTTRETV